jgi:hypothetical protein
MALAVRDERLRVAADSRSAGADLSLVRGVVAGLCLVAPFWIALALAFLIQLHR